jgi:exodeoxyribonuclease VII large subunit
LRLVSPRAQVRQARERIAALKGQAHRAGKTAIENNRARLRRLAAQLDALSPLAVLGRGYSLTWKETAEGRRLVRAGVELAPGDAVTLQFGRGAASARIEATEERESHGGDV